MTYVPSVNDLIYLAETSPQYFDDVSDALENMRNGIQLGNNPVGITFQERDAERYYEEYLGNGGPPLEESPIPTEERSNYGGYEDGDNGRQSFVGGLVECAINEIKGLFELAYALVMLRADIALAADGSLIDWDLLNFMGGFNLGQDMIDVAGHLDRLSQIEAGNYNITLDMDGAQQASLYRVRAKLQAIRDMFEQMGEDTVNILAAWDVHIEDEEYGFSFMPNVLLSGNVGGLVELTNGLSADEIKDEITNVENLDLVLPQNVNAALSMIAEGLSGSYSPSEWRQRADAGKDILEQTVNRIVAQAEAEPWGTAGKAVCIIALTVIPIGALARAGRVLRRVFVDIDNSPAGVDLDDAMRRANDAETDTPETPDADTTPEVDTTPDADDIIEPEGTGDTTNAEDPNGRETPDPDPNTTNVPRTARIGNAAEADARRRLRDEGFEVFELKNGSGHGPDIIAVHPGPPRRIRVVEVKANGSRLNPLQQEGGPTYMQGVFDRISRLENGGTWNTTEFQTFMRNNRITQGQILRGDYEIWRYRGVDPDADTVLPNAPETTAWTRGTTGREFRIDADGTILRRVNRSWEEYVEPDEYTN